MAHFFLKQTFYDGNHRCLIEKNVPIAFILPSRWQDGAESVGMETTSVYDLGLLQSAVVVGTYRIKVLFLKAGLYRD